MKKGIFRIPKKVEYLGNLSGFAPFDEYGLTKGKIYEPYGLFIKIFSDGCTIPCYLIKCDDNILREKSVSGFKIVED
ncbi:MAG: hypothetical protein ACTSV7_00100 [Candidatus Baldrarchaeia archaeon]